MQIGNMTRWRIKFLSSILILMLISFLFHGTDVQASEGEQEIAVLFSHDIHSYLAPKDDGTGEKYGLARMETLLNERRTENETSILVDAGDFSMGTLYQTLFTEEAAELVMLGELEYDATTLGNHEFDYREKGLTQMLYSALRKTQQDEELQLPKLLLANVDWSKNTTEDNLALKEAWDAYGASDYTIIQRNNMKIGVFGIFGENSADDAPLSGLVFEDRVKTAKKVVKQLRQENVDMIVCLSHSGTSSDPQKSEDELLAKAVPEIDVIVSGHTHSTLQEPIVHGSTYIVSCGCYGHNLGELDLKRRADGRFDMMGYTLHPLTQEIAADEAIMSILTDYQTDIDQDYLSRFGYTYNQVIAHNTVDFIKIDDLETKKLGEEPLANLIADAYCYGVKQAEGENGEPIDAALVGKGMIRERVPIGDVRIKDVYDVCALGIGPNQVAGYPMVGIWMSGKELEAVAEIDASISEGGNAQLYPSGICWTYNPNRLILNRITDVSVVNPDGSLTTVDPERLYRIVTPLYCVQMLGSVREKSKGILSIIPKDANGEPIQDYEDFIIYDQATGDELKEWYCLATYLESFEPSESGIPEVPTSYANLQGRKVMIDSKNPIELMKHPNKVSIALYCVVLLLILTVWFIFRRIRRRKKQI